MLQIWRSSPSAVDASYMNFFDDINDDIKLIVNFGSADINVAVGVAVVNLYGTPISEERFTELMQLIGGGQPTILRDGGNVVEFNVGSL